MSEVVRFRTDDRKGGYVNWTEEKLIEKEVPELKRNPKKAEEHIDIDGEEVIGKEGKMEVMFLVKFVAFATGILFITVIFISICNSSMENCHNPCGSIDDVVISMNNEEDGENNGVNGEADTPEEDEDDYSFCLNELFCQE